MKCTHRHKELIRKRTFNLKNVAPNLINTQRFSSGVGFNQIIFWISEQNISFFNIFCSCPITNKPHSFQILPVCAPVYTRWVEAPICSGTQWAWENNGTICWINFSHIDPFQTNLFGMHWGKPPQCIYPILFMHSLIWSSMYMSSFDADFLKRMTVPHDCSWVAADFAATDEGRAVVNQSRLLFSV